MRRGSLPNRIQIGFGLEPLPFGNYAGGPHPIRTGALPVATLDVRHGAKSAVTDWGDGSGQEVFHSVLV